MFVARIMCAIALVPLALQGIPGPFFATHHETDHHHYHHAHEHTHDGHTHTHWHAHHSHEEHLPQQEDGDHHDAMIEHDGSETFVVTLTPRRDHRRLAEVDVVPFLAVMPSSRAGEAPAVPPPKRPPRLPSTQDDILQLRTIVLLT